MTDQPKPMSVKEAKNRALQLDQSDYGAWRVDKGAIDNLIAAVRAEQAKKHAKELTALQQANNCASDFVRGQERERVMAEFKKLAEKFDKAHQVPIYPFACAKEITALIQSLETTNQKP